MKILVVDDHPLVLDALAHLLPQLDENAEMRSALDAAEAVAILDSEPDVELVLLDLALPGTRGLDFLADLLLDLRAQRLVDAIFAGSCNKLAAAVQALLVKSYIPLRRNGA